MAEAKLARPKTESEAVVDRAKDFWEKSGKKISIILGAILLIVLGFIGYKKFIKEPKERKAADAIFKAESYYGQDSLDKALNGDGQYPGLEKVISDYGGTLNGNRAKYIAGSIYLKKGNFDKAIQYLKDFSTDAPQVQASAYKLLGDAYSEKNNGKEALDYYKKAAHHCEEDEMLSCEALFMAAYTADKLLNDQKQAVELYKEIRQKYGHLQQASQWAAEAEKYLAAHGVYNVEGE